MSKNIEHYFFLFLFIGVLLLVGYIFSPFLGALSLALVLSVIAHPLHKKILSFTHSPSFSAFLSTFFVFLAIIIPTSIVAILLIDEARSVAEYAKNIDITHVIPFLENFEEKLFEILPFLNPIDYGMIIKDFMQMLVQNIGNALSGTAHILISLFVMLFALFYFTRDGERFLDLLITLSPLPDSEDRKIIKKIEMVSSSLIRGTLLVAILQGILVGIGLWIVGIPNPVLLGCISVIGALLPNVGTGLVNVPVLLFLFFTGAFPQFIFLLLWAVIVVGLFDNIMHSYFIGHTAKIHTLFILLSVLGGVITFGISGILLGPLIFGLLLVLIEIYKEKIKQKIT
jgi:predicted PurR-regulated permease PerM